MRLLICALTVLFPSLLVIGGPADDVRLLRQASVPTDAAGLTAWLGSLLPSPASRAKAEALIPQLGDETFAAREKAYAALLRLGPAVLPFVREARQSADPEIARRARACVRLLESRAPSAALVSSAVRQLETFATPDSTRALLDLFAALCDDVPSSPRSPDFLVGDPLLEEQLKTSLVGVVRRSPPAAKTVRLALADRLPERRCAAAIVLLQANVKDALPQIRALLHDRDRGVRLGVARALALRREKTAVPVLIALLEEVDAYSTEAEEILTDLAADTSPPLDQGDSAAARRKRRDAWLAWWKKSQGQDALFDRLIEGKVVRFTGSVKDITKGYRLFLYETTMEGCKADIRGDRLRLYGDHEDADQGVILTAQRAMGRKLWPDRLDITAKLGGTGNGEGAYHVGVSVGRVKVLFHPSYPGGAFRIETVEAHQRFIPNEHMGFTPAPGVMHTMTIRVRRNGESYKLDITVVDGKGGGGKYRKIFEVSGQEMGTYDRVGLQRSGHRGGDALFELLSVKRGKD